MKLNWRLTTDIGSSLLYFKDEYVAKVTSARKLEVTQRLNEYDSMVEDYKRLTSQLSLCEQHAKSMAKDFDESIAITLEEKLVLRTRAETAEAELAQLREDKALLLLVMKNIVEMPQYDQDDQWRLRYLAKNAMTAEAKP